MTRANAGHFEGEGRRCSPLAPTPFSHLRRHRHPGPCRLPVPGLAGGLVRAPGAVEALLVRGEVLRCDHGLREPRQRGEAAKIVRAARRDVLLEDRLLVLHHHVEAEVGRLAVLDAVAEQLMIWAWIEAASPAAISVSRESE